MKTVFRGDSQFLFDENQSRFLELGGQTIIRFHKSKRFWERKGNVEIKAQMFQIQWHIIFQYKSSCYICDSSTETLHMIQTTDMIGNQKNLPWEFDRKYWWNLWSNKDWTRVMLINGSDKDWKSSEKSSRYSAQCRWKIGQNHGPTFHVHWLFVINLSTRN